MRLPDREGDWQIIIGTLMLACSIFLVVLAEAKNRQAEATLKEVKQTIKEVRKCTGTSILSGKNRSHNNSHSIHKKPKGKKAGSG